MSGAPRAGALCALCILLVSGCATNSGIQSGEHVTVYVSMPLRGPEASEGGDAADGAKLALADADGKVGGLAVRAVYLDDTAGHGDGARWSPAAAAANARQATEDTTAIAFLGDFDSGATRSSLPVTNQAHLLQVSPASAAIDLVQPFLGAGDQVPDDVQPTGDRTFGRVIPSDEVQAEAGAEWAKRLGARVAHVYTDGSSFGDVLADAFGEQARAIGLSVKRSSLGEPDGRCGASSVVGGHGGSPPTVAYNAGARPPAAGPLSCETLGLHARWVMASDALLTRAGLQALSRFGPALITSAAEDPEELPAAGQRFVRDFRRRYNHEPGRYAAYGYEAMAVILDSIRRAGDEGDQRDAVVDAFFDTTNRHSILGRYSVDEVGNTTLDRLAGYRVESGRPVLRTPLRASR